MSRLRAERVLNPQRRSTPSRYTVAEQQDFLVPYESVTPQATGLLFDLDHRQIYVPFTGVEWSPSTGLFRLNRWYAKATLDGIEYRIGPYSACIFKPLEQRHDIMSVSETWGSEWYERTYEQAAALCNERRAQRTSQLQEQHEARLKAEAENELQEELKQKREGISFWKRWGR
jgi:hypothetical protein